MIEYGLLLLQDAGNKQLDQWQILLCGDGS